MSIYVSAFATFIHKLIHAIFHNKKDLIFRYDFGLTMYGNKIAAFGGQPTIDSEKIEQYCPDTDTWTFVGRNLVQPERHFFAAISVPERHFKPVHYSFTEGYGAQKSTYSPISNGYTETYTQSPNSYSKVSTDRYNQPSYQGNTDGYINKYGNKRMSISLQK